MVRDHLTRRSLTCLKWRLTPPEGGGFKQRRLKSPLLIDRKVVIACSLLDVLGNHLISDIARRCGKVSASPQMTTPTLFSQNSALAQQPPWCFSLDALHPLTDWLSGRAPQRQINGHDHWKRGPWWFQCPLFYIFRVSNHVTVCQCFQQASACGISLSTRNETWCHTPNGMSCDNFS